jgi:dihydroorotate dehydrogenase electron transfer subunit
LPWKGYFDTLGRAKLSGWMFKDPHAEIVDSQQWGNYFLLSLSSKNIASSASPGQFIMIRVSELDTPLLRRPLSIHNRRGEILEIFFQVCGLGTHLLSQKSAGETLDILGPLGQGFSLDPGLHDREAALIGGGRGIAPLYDLALELHRRQTKIRVYYGGKSASDLPIKKRFLEAGVPLLCSTDDGSYGHKGLVTDLFWKTAEQNSSTGFVYACGPEAMLKHAGSLCRRMGVKAEFSLESKMGCGFGACWGCVAKIRGKGGGEWQKVCEQGPVFPAETIVWPEEDT